MYRAPERVYRSRSPSIMGPDGSEQASAMRGSSVLTRTGDADVESDLNTCASATNDGLSSCEYPMSYRNAPYQLATSRAVPRMPPPRDYRWNLIDPPARDWGPMQLRSWFADVFCSWKYEYGDFYCSSSDYGDGS